jgi:hypothetical protein
MTGVIGVRWLWLDQQEQINGQPCATTDLRVCSFWLENKQPRLLLADGVV